MVVENRDFLELEQRGSISSFGVRHLVSDEGTEMYELL